MAIIGIGLLVIVAMFLLWLFVMLPALYFLNSVKLFKESRRMRGDRTRRH